MLTGKLGNIITILAESSISYNWAVVNSNH